MTTEEKHGTGIEWTHGEGFKGETWNPTVGCSKVSPGCANCYAESLALRFGWTPHPWVPAHAAENVILKPERLNLPLRWSKPRMVFVNSMSDLFHELIPDAYVAEVFAVMALADRHVFQVLTKRPERMRDLLGDPGFWDMVRDGMAARGVMVLLDPWGLRGEGGFLPNVWLGTSIENRRYVGRADVLRDTPAAVRFLSCEPLLGPLIFDKWVDGDCDWGWADGKSVDDFPELHLDGINWVIIGGESGRGFRRMDPEWAEGLIAACRLQGSWRCERGDLNRPHEAFCYRCGAVQPEAGEPGGLPAVFVKQMGGLRPGGALEDLPEGLRFREMPCLRRSGRTCPAS